MLLSACIDPSSGDAQALTATLAAIDGTGIDFLLLGNDADGVVVPAGIEALVTMPWVLGVVRKAVVVGVLPALHSLPFHVARALSAIDILSTGRSGWMPTCAAPARFDTAYGARYALPAGEAVVKYDDFIGATQALWDSWDGDALVLDKASGVYLDSTKVRRVHYEGPYFSTVGPLNAARPKLGYPLLFREPAEEIVDSTVPADVVLIAASSIDDARAQIATASAAPYRPAILLKTAAADVAATLATAQAVGADGVHLTGNPGAAAIAAARALVPPTAFRDGDCWRSRIGVPRPVNAFSKAA
jgi:alkanesulfonate monooxygenase SsuD/methylene tetrahydromethanopterin reductase-like flavin-dependent oxidoreductase (luciferase family)